MTERQLHPRYPEADYGMHGESNPALAKLALVSDARETVPVPTDDTSSDAPDMTTAPADLGDKQAESFPKSEQTEREAPIYEPSYNHSDLTQYAVWHGAQYDTSEKKTAAYWTGKAGRAHADLQNELFLPGRIRIPCKSFVMFLEDNGIEVGHEATARTAKDRRDLNLPVGILQAALTKYPPDDNGSLKGNYTSVGPSDYDLLVGYCEAVLAQQTDSN